jgi:hypothetical protein
MSPPIRECKFSYARIFRVLPGPVWLKTCRSGLLGTATALGHPVENNHANFLVSPAGRLRQWLCRRTAFAVALLS